jgi:integrase
MLTLKRNKALSPYYYVHGTVAGRRVRQSTGCTDKSQAEAYCRELEAQLLSELDLGGSGPVTFADAVAAYVNAGGEPKYLERLLDYFGAKPMREIGQVEADAAAAALYPDAKASTINRQCIGPIIRLHRLTVRAEMPGAQLRLIKMRREEKPIITPATDKHLERLWPFLRPSIQALISLMTFTGLRTGEALKVTEADCRDGFVHVGKTKNGEPAMVPIPEGWEFPAGGWGVSTTQGVGKILRKAHTKAGLPYRDGHELGRHAFAARMLADGATLKEVQEGGRWKKLTVVSERYGHLEKAKVHDHMRALSRRGKLLAKCAEPQKPSD